jgi:hypothetical protein
MSINGINSSAASWAQFVKITQAARERNGGGFTPNGVNDTGSARSANNVSFKNTVQDTSVVSFKKAFDVYSSKLTAPAQTSLPVNEVSRKAVGGQFDAYA